MAGYDPNSVESLLQELDKPLPSNLIQEDPGFGFSQQGALEFLGQALWGGFTGGFWSLPEIYDAANEAASGNPNQLEEIVTSLPARALSRADVDFTKESYSGDFSPSATDKELTTAGKLGYTLGNAAGMLLSFSWLGKGINVATRGVSSLRPKGVEIATKLAQDDISSAFGQMVFKSGQKEGVQEFTEDISKEIATTAIDVVSKSGGLHQATKKFGDSMFVEMAKKSIKEEALRPLLGNLDDTLLDDLAKETFEIAKRRAPDEGMNIINNSMLNLIQRAPGLRGLSQNQARITAGITGAIAYDAIMGTVIGATRGFGEYRINKMVGLETPESVLGHMFDTAKHEAGIFSLLGPAKFIKGGGTATAFKKTKDMTRGIINQLKPIKNMSPKELEKQIELYYQISGENLATALTKAKNYKWSHKTDKWWRGVSKLPKDQSTAAVKDMREILMDTRKMWLKQAPGTFARELGADMFYSLPRMATGAVSMNLVGLHDSIKHYGVGVDGILEGFGATDYEKFANILTAMYFTKTPHSFHLVGAPYSRGIFETGNIKQFSSAKAQQFSQVVTGLNILGAKNFESAGKIASQYGGFSDRTPKMHQDKIYSKAFEASGEVQKIKETIDPFTSEKYVTPEGEKSFGGLVEAGSKYIADNIKDPGAKAEWRDKLSTSLEILRWHEDNSIRNLDISAKLSKESAGDLINKLSSIQFDGTTLNRKEARQQMDDWLATRIEREGNVPIDILKAFVVDTYNELGQPGVVEMDGKIIVPRIGENLYSSYMDANPSTRSDASEAIRSLVTAVDKLEKAGVVKYSNEVFENTSLDRIKNSIDIKNEATVKMMQYVYGDAWQTKAMDDGILRNDSWYISHIKMSDAARMLNVEKVLKGSGKSSLDENNSNRLYEGLRDELSGNRFPDIVDAEKRVLDEYQISQNADLSNAIKDMRRVHKLISLVKPENNSRAQKQISPERLIELQSQWTRLLGDVVTNNKAYEQMQGYLIGKSIKQLGISRLAGGYNMHASIHELVTNREFFTDQGMQIPNVDQVVDMLKAKRRNNQIDKETYKDIKDYYERIVGVIQDSNFGSIQIRNMTEQQPGAWYEAIRSSMITGKGRASQFAVERITDVIDKGIKALDRNQMYAQELLVGASRREANTNKEKKLYDLFRATNGDLQQSVDKMKRALESGDGLIVHAFESRMDKISELLDLAVESMPSGKHGEYIRQITKQIAQGMSKAQRDGWTELNVVQEAHRIMSRYTIPEKDKVSTGLRISSSQFAQKYGLNITDMTDMFLSYKSMDTTMKKTGETILKELNAIETDMEYNGKRIFSSKSLAEIDKSKKYVNSVISKSGSPNPNNFWKDIVEPLSTSIRMNEMIRNRQNNNKAPLGGWDKFNQTLLSDISSITTAYFSSMPVKQYTYRDGQLFVSNKQVGYTDKYGLQGVIQALNGTTEISLLSNSFYIDGKYTPKPNRKQMDEIIRNLEMGEGVPVEMEGGFREFMSDSKKIEDQNIAQGNETLVPNRQRFKVIAADESTLMLVRIGRDGRIQKDLASAFRKSELDSDNNRLAGGHLYERLQAVLQYNKADDSVVYPSSIRKLIDKINENRLSDNDIHDAVVLTRFLNDRPSMIGRLDEMTPAERKKSWKYLKLSEMKNGFVGHEENLARVRSFLEGAANTDKSGFFKNVLDRARIFLPKDKNAKFPKMKLLSIADEMVHEGGKINIFSSIDHKTAELTKLKDDGVISERTFDENIKAYKNLSKSIVDGETYLSKNAYIANLALMGGISPDMITFNPDGSVKEIKVGGIKPTISHTDVKTDISDVSQYGRVKEFYLKSAFKYNPQFDQLFKDLGVDGITFNSSNKINEFRNNLKDPWYNTDLERMESTISAGGKNVHASLRPIDDIKQLPKDFDGVGEWLGKNIIYEKTNISEIPFESINLKSLGQPHDPLVGSNLSVHMHDNVGIKDWIGLDAKIKNVYSAFENYVDPYYATRLARDLFAHSSETGDMAWLNTGIDHFLKNDGLLISPWAKTKIEEKIIPYFMNNGMIAAGRVNEGSLDVMTADLGGLKNTVIHTSSDGSKSVQLYGEFLQSKHSAGKVFKMGGTVDRPDVESVIIQRTPHASFNIEGDYQLRTSDAFMITRGNQKYLIVEGKGIDKDGNLRDIYNDSKIKYEGSESDNIKAQAYNRNLFKQIEKKENSFLSQVKRGETYSEVMTRLYNFDNTMSIGSLNSRQPRNQAGDIVISRLKAFEKDGKIITHTGDFAGNSSRMNHADAINPQDADYDMDKSSSYLAAPNRLWAEAARLSGYRTVNDVKGLNAIFDQVFSKNYPELFTFESRGLADPYRYKAEINATDLARGRFVKMHQTMTYLHNIFRDNPTMIRMKSPFKAHDTIEVRMSTDKLRYFNSVDQVSANVKLFLDMYKENPTFYTENPNTLLRELFFGFDRNGIKQEGLFDLYDSKTGERIRDKSILDISERMSRVREDIYNGLISPINRYLKYNKGTTVDESNRDVSATLQDYQNARRGLLFSILPNKNGLNYRVEKTPSKDIVYENKFMYESANNYFAESLNPFDVAMRELHKVSNKHYGFDEINPGSHYILNYLREGRMPDGWVLPKNIDPELTREFELNTIARQAMTQLAKKSGDIIRFEELTANLRRINSKLEYLDSIGGGRGERVQETMEYQNLLSEKIRSEQLKSIVEESLSYDPTNPNNDYVSNPAKKKPRKKGKYTNFERFPVVVAKPDGTTKEVILPNMKNTRDIYSNDRLVINGHRYEIVDGQSQMGLRSDYKAFGGKVKYVRKDGKVVHISRGEQTFIDSQYRDLLKEINQVYSDLPIKNQASLGEYAAKRTALILDKLASPDFANQPERQMALLFRMLRPNWDSKVSPIIPTRYGNHSSTAVVGSVKYIENKLAKSVWNALAQVANGSIETAKGGLDKQRANTILKDLIALSRNYYVQERTGVPVDMSKLEKIGYTEPTELPNGYMTDAQYLNKGIFQLMREGNSLQKQSAGLMYDYLSGKKLVDSATLYRASMEMERSGIPVNQQFMMKVYDRKSNTFGDVEVRDFGLVDAHSSKNRGQAGVMKESTSAKIEELFKCLTIK